MILLYLAETPLYLAETNVNQPNLLAIKSTISIFLSSTINQFIIWTYSGLLFIDIYFIQIIVLIKLKYILHFGYVNPVESVLREHTLTHRLPITLSFWNFFHTPGEREWGAV